MKVKELQETGRDAANRAYDLMFSMATGALALSVTFRGAIAPQTAQQVWLLSVAWGGFTVCSLSHVVGLLLSASVDLELAKKFNALVERLNISSELELPRDTTTSLFTGRIKAKIAVPHFVMGFSFIMAIIAFLAFALANSA
jgi:hypothetical protein